MSDVDSSVMLPRRTLPLWKHPAVWTFAVCWIASMSYLLWRFGLCEAVTVWSGKFAGLLLFCWLTVLITKSPQIDSKPKDPTWKLWISIAVLCLVIFRISDWSPWWTLPGVEQVVKAGGRTAEWMTLPYNYGRNPTAYCLIPLLFLLPFTGLRYLGIERGHRTWQVIALWCTIPLIAVITALVSGSISLGKYAQSLVSHTMQNGPWEEFLWRGALQTRLSILWGAPWGIVLSSLWFGVWHFEAQLKFSGSDVTLAVARSIIMQGVMGLAFGIIYWRTRNLAACSVCHVVFNSLG